MSDDGKMVMYCAQGNELKALKVKSSDLEKQEKIALKFRS